MISALMLLSCAQKAETTETTTQTLEDVMMARRSIRQYTAQPVDRDTLNQILKYGINAPNGMNRQAYEIRIVDDAKMLADISKAVMQDNEEIKLKVGTDNIFVGAPCVIFIGNDTSYDCSQIDCGLLGENIMLSACSMGLGTCCMAFPTRLMKDSPSCAPFIEKLGFSNGYNLLYCIAIGHPDENPDARPRKDDMIKYIE